jgi:hypothetical protein
LTSRTVVTVAKAVAKTKAAAKAANAKRRRMTCLPNKEYDAKRIFGSGGPDCEGRHFPVEPILLIRQGRPCLCHAQIAPEGWLPFGALCKLQAIVRVVSE